MASPSSHLAVDESDTSHHLVRSLFILFIFALVVRVIGILWGGVHGDEKIAISVRVLSGQLIPTDHYYPPLLYYLNAISFAAMFVVGRLTGIWFGLEDFRAQYFQNPAPFEFVARFVTAALTATSAPLAALVAQRLRVSWKFCLLIGVLVALLPAQVLLSHISKSDAPLSAALLLVVWILLKKLDTPTSKTDDIWLGASIALALSFKQSALFLILPLIVGFIGLSLLKGVSWLQLVRSAAVVGITSVGLWIPMNIGILLDFRNFLEYQKVQTQMSFRESGLIAALGTWFSFASSIQLGATLPALIMGLMLPVVCRDRKTLWIWTSTVVAILIVASITGTRQQEGLWIPYSLLMLVLGGVAAARLVTQRNYVWNIVGIVALTAMLLCTVGGTLTVATQALKPPVSRLVADTLLEIPDLKSAKVLYNLPTTIALERELQVDPEAIKRDRQRHERLAQKYSVTLPPFAPDRLAKNRMNAKGYYLYRHPWVIGGLEAFDEKDIKVVKPFAWPLQKEEYQLDYWLKQGFSIFVTNNEENLLKSPIAAFREIHEQLRDRCQLVKEIPAQKPLFLEAPVRIYDKCRSSSSAQGGKQEGKP